VTFSLVAALVDAITTVMTTIGIPGLFALMAVESFGLPPIPSEVILPFAGFLVADGTFSFGWALTAALAGSLLGAYAAYAVGRWWRHRLTGLGIGRLRLEPRHLERVDRFFAGRGEISVALVRMVPVIRSYISYPAGTARMEPIRFGLYTLLGAAPFTVGLIYAGVALGSHWTLVRSYFSLLDLPLVAFMAFVIAYLALQVAGVLAPGWPPRRSTGPSEPTRPPPST